MELRNVLEELSSNPLPTRNRLKQHTFGVVSRRGMPPDYSKLCVSNTRLYGFLLDLGAALDLTFSSVLLIEEKAGLVKLRNPIGRIAILVANKETQGDTLTFTENPKISINNENSITILFYTISHDCPPASVEGIYFKRGNELIQTKAKVKKVCPTLYIETRDVVIEFS